MGEVTPALEERSWVPGGRAPSSCDRPPPIPGAAMSPCPVRTAAPSAQSPRLLENRPHPAAPAPGGKKSHTVCGPWWPTPGLPRTEGIPGSSELEDSRGFLRGRGGTARARPLTGGLAVVMSPGEEGRGSSLASEWPGLDGKGQGAPTLCTRV